MRRSRLWLHSPFINGIGGTSQGTNRGGTFEAFLAHANLKADTVFAPLMPGKVGGGTEQVVIRSAEVLKKLNLVWSH